MAVIADLGSSIARNHLQSHEADVSRVERWGATQVALGAPGSGHGMGDIPHCQHDHGSARAFDAMPIMVARGATMYPKAGPPIPNGGDAQGRG